MATARIEQPDMVSLNGHLFRIKGQVIRQIANRFAEKTVIGDFTEQSDPVLSNITWRDMKDGMGRYSIHPDEQDGAHFHSFWYGNIRNTLPGHILPSTRRANVGVQANDSVGIRNGGTQIFKFATGLDNNSARQDDIFWGIYSDSGVNASSQTPVWFINRTNLFIKNLLGQPKDFEIGQVGGTTLFTVAESTTTEWAYGTDNLSDSATSSAGTEWHSDTSVLIHRLAYWRDLLWGVSKTGNLYFTNETTSTTSLNWVDLGQAARVNDTQTIRRLVTGEMTIPGREDQDHLFLVRNDGFDIYDRLTEKFVPALRMPPLYRTSWGGHSWNGSFFYPHGMSLYQWTPAPGGNIVNDVGFTTADGIPDQYSGHIYDVASSPRELYVTVKAKNYVFTDQSSMHDGLYSRTINTGWTQVVKLDAEGSSNTFRGVVEAPMLIIGDKDTTDPNSTAGRMEIYGGWRQSGIAGIDYVYNDVGATTIGNDSHGNQMACSTSATLVTPWVVSDPNQTWVAHKLSAELQYLKGASSLGVTFNLDYATDFKGDDSHWVNVITATGTRDGLKDEGLIEANLPNKANPIGVPFSALRLRARWSGASPNDDGDQSYDLHRMSLTFQKKPKFRYAFSFEIDLRGGDAKQPSGSVRQSRQWLDEFYEQPTLAEFAYFDEHPGGSRTYYVTPLQPQASEETGHSPEGTVQMTVMEVV